MTTSVIPAVRRRFQHQTGASLIEVLVAILLVALGILAMGAMQANSTRIAKTTEFRAMGALLAADLADRMRANTAGVLYRTTPGAAAVNKYKFEEAYPSNGVVDISDTSPECNSTACEPDQMASYDLIEWRKAVAASLPGGWVRVSEVDTSGSSPPENAVDLWLMWVDPDGTVTSSDTSTCPSSNAPPPPPGEEGEGEGEEEEETETETTGTSSTATVVTPRCMYFRINL